MGKLIVLLAIGAIVVLALACNGEDGTVPATASGATTSKVGGAGGEPAVGGAGGQTNSNTGGTNTPGLGGGPQGGADAIVDFWSGRNQHGITCGQFIDMTRYKQDGVYVGFDFLTGHLLELDVGAWSYQYLHQLPDHFIHGVLYHPERDLIYYVELLAGELAAFDPNTLSSTVVVDGLSQPTHLVMEADGSLLVTEAGAGRLLRIDPLNPQVEVVAQGLDFPDVIKLTQDGQYAWITLFRHSGGLVRVDLSDGSVVPLAADTSFGSGMVLLEQQNSALVVEAIRGKVQKVDLTTGNTVRVGHLPLLGPAYTDLLSDGETAWIMEAVLTRVRTLNLTTESFDTALNFQCGMVP